MPISQSDREDVLTTVRIELERMFTILSNVYDAPELIDRALFLEEIESTLNGTIRSLGQ